jgi:hypothetical protein
MDNPYQSPSDENVQYPHVEVVLRRRWVGRTSQQIYRFCSPIDNQNVVRENVVSFFLRENCRLLTSSNSHLEFERLGTSAWYQLVSPLEKSYPHRIQVILVKTNSGTLITCTYELHCLLPNLMIPPHPFEKEARLLALECDAR